MDQTPIRDPQTYNIIGAAMTVHRELGHGFLEAVYRAAMPIELERRGIAFALDVALPVSYKGIVLPVTYKADLICGGDVVVELKALDRLTSREESQLLNYLKATGIRRGLLINFGAPSLEYMRRVWG